MAFGLSVFVQLHDKLTDWMVEMSGFNQPPQLSAKDFRQREGMLKQVKQILPIYAADSIFQNVRSLLALEVPLVMHFTS